MVLTSTQPFSVSSDGGGATAADLGLGGSSTGNTLSGLNINPAVINGQSLNLLLLRLYRPEHLDRIADASTLLSDLNGGAGVSFPSETGKDLEIKARDGTVIDVDLGSATTLGGVISLINAASTKGRGGPGQDGARPHRQDRREDRAVFGRVDWRSSNRRGRPRDRRGPDHGADQPQPRPGRPGLADDQQPGLPPGEPECQHHGGDHAPVPGPGHAVDTRDEPLSSLQDGQGIQFAGGGQADLQVTLHNGTVVNVSLGGATTIGAVLDKLNAAATGLTAAISASGLGLTLIDATTGPSAFTVTALNGSSAPAQLGILGVAGVNGTIEGTDLSGASLANNIFIQNATLGGKITLGGSVNASASFGFLGVKVQNGTATATASASFTLGNIEQSKSGGYSTVSDLGGALGNVALSVVAANPGPADGRTGISYGTSTFGVQVGNGPITTVTIQKTAVPSPKTLADLISNLNSSLGTAGLGSQVRALNSGGYVGFTLQGGVAQTLTILNAGVLGFTATQSAYVVRPSVTLTADVNLPIALGSSFSGLNPADLGTGITFKTPPGGIPFDLDFAALQETPFSQYTKVNLGQLNNLTGFNFTTFVSALNLGLSFLNDTVAGVTQSGSTALAFLGEPLPLINVSLRDILSYATSFSNFLTQLVNNPSDNLQDLANQIAGLLGLPAGSVALGLDTSLTGTVPAPTGGIPSGVAHFQLVLDGASAVNVVVPVDMKAKSVKNLVADINAALKTAGLASRVVAETSGAYITLAATGSSPAATIVVQGIPSGDPAATELGFANGQKSSLDLRLGLNYVIASYANTFTPDLNLGFGTGALGFAASAAAGDRRPWLPRPALAGDRPERPEAVRAVPLRLQQLDRRRDGSGPGCLRLGQEPQSQRQPGTARRVGQRGHGSCSTTRGLPLYRLRHPAQIVLGLSSPASGTPPSGLAGRHTLTDPILRDLGAAQADAHIAASLPIYLGSKTTGQPLLTVTLDDDLTNPLNPTITPNPSTISTDIAAHAGVSQALSGLASSINALLGPVLDGIDGQVLGSDLPLIGPGIAQAANFLSGLKNGFVSALNTAADSASQAERIS